MKIPLSVIKNFLEIKKEAKDIAHLLTSAGIEVDNIENENPSFSNVVSAKILEVAKHPDSEKLTVAKVSDGKEIFQVVCGASNCRKDIIVAFAKIGATLTDDQNNPYTIKKAKLRNVESYGMLCSSKELKFAKESDKIIEFPINFEIGKDLSFLSSPIFEISLTPNLGHLLNALGLARELACLTKTKIQMPKLNLKEENKPIEKDIKIKIEDQRTLRYCSRIIENVTIAPSPFWLKKELEECGFKSINNIVDATNYIMLKFGQPLHAFDYDKIENQEIKVTNENENTKFLCLDQVEREIPKNALVIKDKNKTLAIAGIIGGLNSSITDNTKKVILESAYFDPSSIRKTSKILNLKTESSMRFEKSIDFNMTALALDYAAELISQLSGGKILKGKIDLKNTKFSEKKLSLRFNRVKKILGTSISENEIIDIFQRLDFKIIEKNEEAILLEIPSYRNDINYEIDLIEEVARIFGYNNISKVKPFYQSSSVISSESYLFEKNIKSYLRTCSLQEIKTCDLISPSFAEIALLNLDRHDLIEVKHYKSIDQSILRPTLLPSLLEVVKFNQDHNNLNFLAFEIAKVYYKLDDQYIEKQVASIVLSGKRNPHFWDKSNFDVNFYDLKGMLENILSVHLQKNYKFNTSHYKGFHPFRQAKINHQNNDFGVIGEVHPFVLNKFDLKKRVFFAEIDLDFLFKNRKVEMQFTSIPQYPGSQRDLTISLNEKQQTQEIFDIIKNIKSPLLEKFYLLELYKNVENKNNVTFRFIYRDKTKTISNEEIESEHEKISTELIKQLEK
jgi:phenylalanyl-tRNA synthetase beta chain